MTRSNQLSASLEDYLETIYNIVSDKGGVRAKDISVSLDVKAGSVTTALQALAKSGLINYKPYEVITLTEKGLKEAQRIIRKHEILEDFFVDILGADKTIARQGACEIEHVIPDELLERLISFTEFVQACPRCGDSWVGQFHKLCFTRFPQDKIDCMECIETGIKYLQREKEKISSDAPVTTLLDVVSGDKGSKCVVKKVTNKSSVTKRFVEMGISRGSVIEVERVAPLGDPIEVKVKGYHLSIRKEEAKNIQVEWNI